VAEIPFESNVIGLGSIEFVADAVIILKHRIERGLLTRSMEIRKMRGAPITISEFPFTITAKKGIEVFIPPILAEIGSSGRELKPPCSLLDSILDHIHVGHCIYVEYPPDFRMLEVTPFILGVVFRNSLKALILSYRYSPETLMDLLVRAYRGYCDKPEKIVSAVKKRIAFVSLNPFRYSLGEGIAEEFRAIRESGADAVLFHGVELPASVEKSHADYIPWLYNQINTLKQEQRLVIRIGAALNDELSRLYYDLADIVIKFIPSSNYGDFSVYIWRRGAKPFIISSEDVRRCVKEVAEQICSGE